MIQHTAQKPVQATRHKKIVQSMLNNMPLTAASTGTKDDRFIVTSRHYQLWCQYIPLQMVSRNTAE
jgi:hypothetical protein